jgi:uncharacterized protein HemX
MSIITRVLLVLALVLGGVCIYFTGALKTDKQDQRTKLATETDKAKKAQEALKASEEQRKAKEDELAKAQGEVKAAQQQLAETTGKVTTLQKEVDDLKAKMAAAPAAPAVDTTKIANLEKELADTKAKVAAAEDQVKKANDEVKAKSDQLTALSSERNVLNEKLAKTLKEIKWLKGEPDWPMPLPEGLTAKVLYYDKTWNFVVLDKGKKQGVVQNGKMILHRGTDILGQVRIATVDDDCCIGDLLGSFKKMDPKKEPKPGDLAIP